MLVADNPFPYLLFEETSAPDPPPEGCKYVFVDPTDHQYKTIDSDGTIVPFGGGGSVATVEGVSPDGTGNIDLGLAAVATTGAYGDLSGTPVLGSASMHAAGDFDAAGAAGAAQAAAIAASQPSDPDLTAIAALTTTPFGRSLLELATAAALRAAAALGTGATLNVAAAGDAAAGELVKGDDSRLTGGGGGGGAVTSVNGNTGAVVLSAADVGAAALASPTFTGDPKAPTPSSGDNDTSIATTAFVHDAVAAVLGSAPPAALDTLRELADAINDDASFAATITTALAAKAPLASPALTGNPTAPTQASGNNSTRLATTAFVAAALAAGGGSSGADAVDDPTKFAAAFGTLQISDEFEATSAALPAAYSWVNQGGATYDEKLGTGVIVGTNQAGDQGRCIFRSLSGLTATWTAVAKAVVGIGDGNYTYAGIMLRESSSGKCYAYRLANDSTLALETWPAAAGASGSLGAAAPPHRLPVYFKIVKGASTTSFYYSRDGRAWRSFATGVSLSFCTPDQIGFFTGCNGGGDNQISIHWLRIY